MFEEGLHPGKVVFAFQLSSLLVPPRSWLIHRTLCTWDCHANRNVPGRPPGPVTFPPSCQVEIHGHNLGEALPAFSPSPHCWELLLPTLSPLGCSQEGEGSASGSSQLLGCVQCGALAEKPWLSQSHVVGRKGSCSEGHTLSPSPTLLPEEADTSLNYW